LNTSSQPLTARAAFRVESFLLARTETRGKTLFLIGDGKREKMDTWWSARLVGRVKEAFLTENIDKHAKAATSV
jgi:hypothetical protein